MRHQGHRLALFLAFALGACGRSAPDPGEDRGEFNGVGPLASAVDPPAAAPQQRTPRATGPRARGVTPAAAGESWNDAAIDWQPYEAGLERARAQKKPVCLVFFADWCPHCKTYSHVFEDQKVVERARDFVMIRVNADQETEVNHRYARDGTYVPRTYFLGPDGALDPDIHAPRPKFLYFYDEHNPGALLAGMDQASRKFKP